MDLILIQTLGVCVAAIALVFNAYFSVRRLIHDERSRNISALDRLLVEWTSEKFRESVEYVVKDPEFDRKNLKGLPLSDLAPIAKSHVLRVSRVLDQIAYRVVQGEASFGAVALLLGSRYCEIWNCISSYIIKERAQKDAVPDLRCYSEAFSVMISAIDLPVERRFLINRFLAKQQGKYLQIHALRSIGFGVRVFDTKSSSR